MQQRVLVSLALTALLFSGCGQEGRERFRVSGKISFQGKPLPAGTIMFDPDTRKNPDSVQGFAEIHDGYYDTSATGKGTTGGAVVVRINGGDGQTTPSAPYGKPIFMGYSTKLELPRDDTTQDFNVPASAARGAPTSIPEI